MRPRPRASEARGRASARPGGLALCQLTLTLERGGMCHHKAGRSFVFAPPHGQARVALITSPAAHSCSAHPPANKAKPRGRAAARPRGLALCHLALTSERGGWCHHKARRSSVPAPPHGQACVAQSPATLNRAQQTNADPPFAHSFARRRRRALPITETELRLMAAAAKMGGNSRPKAGYSTPAAIGTPSTL